MNREELRQILAEGEGYRIEFKEQLSNIDKDIVAFSNSAGGCILIGVRDDSSISGIKNFNKLKSEVETIAHNCDPSIKIIIEKIEDILIVHIKEGSDKPYKCKTGFYVRNGANSQKLTRNEIIGLFTSEGKIRFEELVNKKFIYNKHFDPKKFNRFLRLAEITKVLNTPDLLVNLGIAKKQKRKLLFNNAGVLVFSKNLEDIYYHTTVTCALFKGVEKVHVLDRKDFNEDIVSNIDDAMNFLKKHIPVRYEMTGMPRRREIPEIPFDALREAVINAILHRDYFEKGANVMVEIFDDRIEITNPGGLVKGMKTKDIGKKSILRNPLLAGLLSRIHYIEKMGTGISKMQSLMKGAGLKPVKFQSNLFFTAIFRRPIRLVEGLVEGLVENQRKILDLIGKNPRISKRELAKALGISTTAIDKNIATLRTKRLLSRVGSAKTGYWKLEL